MKKPLKYIFVTLSAIFGIFVAFFQTKAGTYQVVQGNSASNDFFDHAYADTPTGGADPGCSGSGCSDGGSG